MKSSHPARAGRALFLFVLSIFLLTMGGHTYAPDDESMFYVTQNILTRGSFDIPNGQDYPVVGGERGLGGKIYPGQGVAQSVAAIPFYLAGSLLARAAEPRFAPYLLRLAVGLFDPVVSAFSAVLLFACLCRLGFRVRTAAAVALIWAFATMAWVYAKTFLNEPLTTCLFLLAFYAVLRFRQAARPGWAWPALAALAACASVFVKLQGVLLFIPLGVYLGWAILARADLKNWRQRLAPLLAFGVAAAAMLALWLWFNWYRFGSVFRTGYGPGPGTIPIGVGLYGLLLSPGKSLFLYAPPVLLSFLALPDFWRRARAELVACALLAATVVLFHARIEYWHGDGAWGPRYMYLMLPFALLPAASWLERARGLPARALTAAVVGAGAAVTLLGAVVNFDAYLQVQPNQNARYYAPAQSPVVGQWDLLQTRVRDWYAELIAPTPGIALLGGWLQSNGSAGAEFPRYAARRATLAVFADASQPLQARLQFADYRPANLPRRTLAFSANGAPLPATRIESGDPGYFAYAFTLAAPRPARVWIEMDTLGSRARGPSPMGDELGLQVQGVSVSAGGAPLDLLKDLALPPLPVAQPKAQWAWFFAPALEHFDFWWWYLYFSGLPHAVVWAIALPTLLVSGVAAAASGIWLVKELRSA